MLNSSWLFKPIEETMMAEEIQPQADKEGKAQTKGDVAQLSSQVDELNKKIDTLNAKLDKSQAKTEALMDQQKAVLDNTNAVKSQEIVRQTVSNPTGFIAKEIVNYIVKSLEKNQKSKTQQWFATRGRGVAETAIAFYISQKLPQLNWYGTSVSGTESQEKYHVNTTTNFPVTINTGVPFIGNIALARVVLNVESDVNTRTNETSNVQCHLSTAEVHKDLLTSLQEDLINWLKPHKKTWAVVHPVAIGILEFFRFMKRNPNFSIPFLVLFIFTALIAPQMPPAQQIWTALGWASTNLGFFGIRPMSLLYGIINGIIWGVLIWAIIRFHLIPGAGKVIKFITTKIFPAIGRWFSHPYRRWGTLGAIGVCIVLFILWRVGVFEPPRPLQFMAAAIPNGRASTAYAADFTSIGGKAPYIWNALVQSVPEGLSFDSTKGKLSGTPTAAGNYVLTIQVTDSSRKPKMVSQDFNLNISAANALIITDTSLPKGKVGVEYKVKISTLGGAAPFRWGIVSGALPQGIILGADGTFSGKPRTAGTFPITISVDDSSATKMGFDQAFTLIIE